MRTDSHSACRSPALMQQSKLRARNLEDAAPGLMYSNWAATDIRLVLYRALLYTFYKTNTRYIR